MQSLTDHRTKVQADGRKAVRQIIGRLPLTLTFRAKGHKSSEGDGRTAEDIRRELRAKAQEE